MKKFVIMFFAVIFSAAWSIVAFAEEADVKLQEVVVTATKTEKDPKDVTQSVTVITADEIKKSGATNAAEVVRKAAGVSVQEYGPRGSVGQVTVRGAGSAQVLVLLDGRRLNSARSGGYNLTDLPVALDDIERIELVRGPSSALYGADAVGGVVNIITKRPVKNESRITGVAGSHGYDALSVNNSGRSGGLFYSLSAGRETSDGYRVNSDLAQRSVGGKLGYELGKESSLSLNVNYLGKELGVPGSLTWQTPFARQWTRDTVAGLEYKTRFSRELDMKVTGYYNRETLRYIDFPDASKHKGVTDGADVQFNWLAGSWNTVTVGVEARGDSVVSTDAGTHATRLMAGDFQDELSLGGSLIIVLGGRYDSHSVYGDQVNPRASARYLISGTGTVIRTSAGRSFRAPTLNNLYWSDAWGNIGNPDLRPETAKEYEAGIEQPLGKGSSMKVTGFNRKVKDLIDWQEYAPFQYTPVNIGRATIKGIEAETRIRLAEPLEWVLNYTYINPVDETTGEKIYYTIPQTQVKSAMNISVGAKMDIYLEGRMVENYVTPGEAEWKYSVMDAKVTQKAFSGSKATGQVFFGMNNIFDRKYQTVRNYPMPPKEIYGGVTVQF